MESTYIMCEEELADIWQQDLADENAAQDKVR